VKRELKIANISNEGVRKTVVNLEKGILDLSQSVDTLNKRAIRP
jgi:hypothetical protein